MSFIEKIEIDCLKQAIKTPLTYIIWLLFASSLLFVDGSVNYVLLLALAYVLALVLVVDFKHYIIPDSTQIILFVFANIFLLSSKQWLNAYAGFVVLLVIFGGIYYFYEKVVKKHALGFGDVKLFAVAGLYVYFTGFTYFLLILTTISMLVLLVRLFIKNKQVLIPYGPMIVVAMWLTFLFNDNIKLFHDSIMRGIF